MNRKIQPLLNLAQHYLTQNPYDVAHDLSHHQRVWSNAQFIAKNVRKIHNQPDMSALHVACLWHDVVLGEKQSLDKRDIHVDHTIEYLSEKLSGHHFSDTFQKKVLTAIKQHQFSTSVQSSIEAQILFDADKLDALSPERYTKIITAYNTGAITESNFQLYAKTAQEWFKTMRSRLYFDVSKQEFDTRFADLVHDPVAQDLADKMGISFT